MSVAATVPELRDYQRQDLDTVWRRAAEGVRRQLVAWPTGAGKTCLFVAAAREVGGRTLVLAHRDELIGQAADRVRAWWPDADIGVVKAEANAVHADVVIASVQTLARRARLAQLVAWPVPFSLVVVDEAHHARAETYRRILAAVDCGPDPDDPGQDGETWAPPPGGPLLLGVTATPDRGDGKGLDGVFDEIVAARDILWGIRAGYLCDLRGLRVALDLDLRQVKTVRGDYADGQLGAALEDAGAPAAIAAAICEHAAGRKTLVFTPTVETAQHTAQECAARGLRAEAVWGAMPLEERRAVLARLTTGETQVVTNCAVLTEGFDEPTVDCIVMARPTKSRALYAQCVGRGTRRHPDKADCLVVDVVGVTDVHDLCSIPSLLGVEKKAWDERRPEATAVEVIDEWEREQVRVGKLKAEEVQLFAALRHANLAWVKVTDGRYALALGNDARGSHTLILKRSKDDETLWSVGVMTRTRDGEDRARAILRNVDQSMAQGAGEDFARKHSRSSLTFADAEWRRRKPTERQVAAAKRWGIDVPPGALAGQLSDMMEARIQRAAAKRWANKVGTKPADV